VPRPQKQCLRGPKGGTRLKPRDCRRLTATRRTGSSGRQLHRPRHHRGSAHSTKGSIPCCFGNAFTSVSTQAMGVRADASRDRTCVLRRTAAAVSRTRRKLSSPARTHCLRRRSQSEKSRVRHLLSCTRQALRPPSWPLLLSRRMLGPAGETDVPS